MPKEIFVVKVYTTSFILFYFPKSCVKYKEKVFFPVKCCGGLDIEQGLQFFKLSGLP